MNAAQRTLASLLCTSVLASCVDVPVFGADNSSREFTFDLSNPELSYQYTFKKASNFTATTAILEPYEQYRLAKIVDDRETVVSFSSDQLVTKAVFTPSLKPKLLSVSYIKHGFLYNKRFRKLYGWNEVSLDDYNYLMFELSQRPTNVTLDVANIDRVLFRVRRERYSQYELLSVTVPPSYRVTRVVSGKQLVWRGEDQQSVHSAFVSVDSTPAMLCLSVATGNRLVLKTYTSFGAGFNEVAMSEFRFVLGNFMSGSADLTDKLPAGAKGRTLDLSDLDVSSVELSYGVLDSIAFVNVHPLNAAKAQLRPEERVTKVMVDGYVLWASNGSAHCLNVAYTVDSEPRLYNILVSEEKTDQKAPKNKDQFHYFMREKGSFYSLPEADYTKKAAELSARASNVVSRPARTNEQVDLRKLVEELAEDEWRTFLFTPGQQKRVSSVVCGGDVVWVASGGERLELAYFFKNGARKMLQLLLADADDNWVTRYFMYDHTNTAYDHSDGERTPPKFNKWLWVSSPVFFSHVPHVQLVKTFLSLDVLGKLDRGVLYHRSGVLGGVFVRAFTAYPSYSVTSLFESDRPIWAASEGEEVLAFCLFGSADDDESPDHGVVDADDQRLAELYVKQGDSVKRVFLAKSGSEWKGVTEGVFNFMYSDL